jgi:hypothetical protein
MKTQEEAGAIQQQLRELGQIRAWSWMWHASEWVGFEHGLSFKIEGSKFQGTLRLTLIPSNGYRVEFIKSRMVQMEYVSVSFENLVTVIDAYVK